MMVDKRIAYVQALISGLLTLQPNAVKAVGRTRCPFCKGADLQKCLNGGCKFRNECVEFERLILEARHLAEDVLEKLQEEEVAHGVGSS